jgi:hypothetical protein
LLFLPEKTFHIIGPFVANADPIIGPLPLLDHFPHLHYIGSIMGLLY